MSSSEPVNIRVLDREYTIGVEPDARDSLMAAAKLLDSKMREVRGANRMAAVDRIAVLAALNLAHELQQLRADGSNHDRELARTLDSLQRKLDGALDATASHTPA
jgi:cell division protein ZapA